MAKISQLPTLDRPTGDERLPVVDAGGATRGAKIRPLVEAAAAPSIARAEAAAAQARADAARTLAQDYGATDATLQGYIRKSDGAFLGPNTAWWATDFLPVSDKVAVEVTARTAASGGHAWYDKDKKFLAGFGDESNALSTITAVPPAGAAYARFCTINTVPLKVRGLGGSYNIPLLKAVSATHINPELVAMIAEARADAAAAQTQTAAVESQLDEMTDATAPMFVDLWSYTKSNLTPATQEEAAVVSRNSDFSLTVALGKGRNFIAGGAMALEDGATNRVRSYGIRAVDGDVITVLDALPASPLRCQTMHDSADGQHLSRLGYLGLADYIVDQAQRYAYRKKLLWSFHGPECTAIPESSPDITVAATGARLVEVTRLNGAAWGGYVAGTTNLTRGCGPRANNENIVGRSLAQYHGRGYALSDAGAGKGFQFRIPLGRRDGFLEIAIGGRWIVYTDSAGTSRSTDGRYRVEVVADDGRVLFDQVYASGRLYQPRVNFSGAAGVVLRVTLVDGSPMSVVLYSAYAFGKSPRTPTAGFFKSGDVIAYNGDSWTQYPTAVAGEVPLRRPDGSVSDGMCYLSERTRTSLAAQGVNVTTLNMGKGGMTSAWGLHWARQIIQLTPKPTHCVINFGINDRNSVVSLATNPAADSDWDFDPANQWARKAKSAGGREGRVTYDTWYANIQAICAILIAAGIKPIVLMPAHTASASQAQELRDFELARISRGFTA